MTLSFFNILTIISISLAMIQTLFLFVNKKGFIFESNILSILPAIFNLQIFCSFAISMFAYQNFPDFHKPLFSARRTPFLIGPLLFFYFKSFLSKKDIPNYRTSIHFFPFSLALIFLLVFCKGVGCFIIWRSPIIWTIQYWFGPQFNKHCVLTNKHLIKYNRFQRYFKNNLSNEKWMI